MSKYKYFKGSNFYWDLPWQIDTFPDFPKFWGASLRP